MTHQDDHLRRAELHAYLDGQLSAESRESARLHLEGCSRCSAAFEDLRRLGNAIRSIPLAHVGESFTERVMTQIGLSTVSAGIFRFIVYLPSVVGLVLVLGIMGGAYMLAGGAGGGEETALAQSGSTIVQWLDSALRALTGWLVSVGSSEALAISAFALGLILVVALGELLPAGPARKTHGRLRDSGSA